MLIDQSVDAAPDQTRVSEYWDAQFHKMREDNSYWLNNQIIAESFYRLMTGTPYHWMTWLFDTYFKDRQYFSRSLSLCCGDGAHEIELYKTGKVKFVRGFDISEGAIQQARVRFEQAHVPCSSYLFDVKDANNLEMDDEFDLILSTGALHHVTNLEDLLGKLRRMLRPDGYFVILEYIGPNRFQWTDQQIAVINDIVKALDVHYVKDHSRLTFARAAVEAIINIDPSEAVRSADVYPLVRQHFAVTYERFCNGAILHQLHPLLNCSLANKGNRDFDSLIRLILLLEDCLAKGGVLPSDFVFMICRTDPP